jgi:predicted nucleic acid-binding protein
LIGIIDTSVALKWYVEESDSVLARPLLQLDLVAPDVILVELANALWKKVRKGQIESSQANEALSHLAGSVKLVPSPALVDEALNLAVEMLHPVYDCLFVALAREVRAPLITADERLFRRLQAFGLGELVVMLSQWRERSD